MDGIEESVSSFFVLGGWKIVRRVWHVLERGCLQSPMVLVFHVRSAFTECRLHDHLVLSYP